MCGPCLQFLTHLCAGRHAEAVVAVVGAVVVGTLNGVSRKAVGSVVGGAGGVARVVVVVVAVAVIVTVVFAAVVSSE